MWNYLFCLHVLCTTISVYVYIFFLFFGHTIISFLSSAIQKCSTITYPIYIKYTQNYYRDKTKWEEKKNIQPRAISGCINVKRRLTTTNPIISFVFHDLWATIKINIAHAFGYIQVIYTNYEINNNMKASEATITSRQRFSLSCLFPCLNT